MTEKEHRVFCVGLSKTATTSLTKALKMLGYRANHFPIRMIVYTEGGLSLDLSKIRKYDALSDLPVARFYKELDIAFPDSKFILTTREMEAWLDSCRRHFWPGQIFKGDYWFNRLHEDIYGSIDYDEDKFREAYKRHKREVLDYFEGREDDLLVMNIPEGDRWEELCSFLEEDIPEEDFPNADCLWTEIFKVFNIQSFR